MTDALEYNPPGGAPPACVLLLHGLGASGDDLFPLAGQIAGGRLRVVCPHAPVRPIDINGGMAMRAWYNIAGADLQSRQDQAGVEDSAKIIRQLLAAEQKRGFAAGQIFIAGFSQGAAMALHVGLRHSPPLAGVVAMSGYVLFADALPPICAQTPPVWMAHGVLDPVVLPAWARQSRDALLAAGAKVEYHEYNMAHNIAPAQLIDLNRWLAAQLGDDKPPTRKEEP